jgi:hypothetical protein
MIGPDRPRVWKRVGKVTMVPSITALKRKVEGSFWHSTIVFSLDYPVVQAGWKVSVDACPC